MNPLTTQPIDVASFSAPIDGAQIDSPRPDAGELPNRLLQAVSSSRELSQTLVSVAWLAAETTAAQLIAYYPTGAAEGSQPKPDQLFPADHLSVSPQQHETLASAARQAMTTGTAATAALGVQATAGAGPVVRRGEQPAAILAVVANEDAELAVTSLQLASAHLTLWSELQMSAQAESDAKSAATIMDMLTRLENCLTLGAAAVTLVNELRTVVSAKAVALGLVRDGKRCQLAAVSGISDFRKGSELATSLDAALDEVLLEDRFVVWSGAHTTEHPSLVRQQVCRQLSADSMIATPIKDEEGVPLAVLLVFSPTDRVDAQPTESFILALEKQLGSLLRLIDTATAGALRRARKLAGKLFGSTRVWTVGTCLAVVAMALMLILVPYRVKCQCEVEPTVRRHIVAPYDGLLQRALVEPGDLVAAGQTLARMDAREIEWELEMQRAEKTRARKDRDSALARGDFREAQQAGLKIKEVQIQMDLLEHRQKKLAIKSPLAGVVVSGDHRDDEGAPVTIGQSLFEIAPLGQMVLEISIPEREIAHVKPGMEVRVWLDSFRSNAWTGHLTRISPRAELRDEQSVFVAEVTVDNSKGELRPGMKGRAKITTPRHSLGWVLFHKPLESISMWLGW